MLVLERAHLRQSRQHLHPRTSFRIEVGFKLISAQADHTPHSLIGARDAIHQHTLAAQQSTEPHSESALRSLTGAEAREIISGKRFIWFYGDVVYDDVFGAEHTHRFFWRYDARNDRFAPYDYEDRNKST